MKAWISKAAIPVLLATGGVVAWSVSGPTAVATTPRAWIDAPIAGSVFTSGPIAVQVHASASGGVDAIQLNADGTTVATTTPKGDERLSGATLTWNGRPGIHSLTVRAKSGGTWGRLSHPVPVTIGELATASRVPHRGPTATTITPGGSSTSSSTSATSESTSTTAPLASTTTSGNTSPTQPTSPPRPTTPGGTHSPTTLMPLTPPAVAVNNTEVDFGDPVLFSAISEISSPHTLSIELRYQTDSTFTTIANCSGSPCRQEYSAFRYYGIYYFRAQITTDDGRTITSSLKTLKVNPVKD